MHTLTEFELIYLEEDSQPLLAFLCTTSPVNTKAASAELKDNGLELSDGKTTVRLAGLNGAVDDLFRKGAQFAIAELETDQVVTVSLTCERKVNAPKTPED